MYRRIQHGLLIIAVLAISACDTDRSPFSVPKNQADGLLTGSGSWGGIAWNTPVAVNRTTNKSIQNFQVGDTVYACDSTLQWHPETVKISAGVGPSYTDPQNMLQVTYSIKGSTAKVVVTPSTLFMMSDGQYKTSQHLIPGDMLKGADGNPVKVQYVLLGQFLTGLQSISTDESIWSGGGHLINVNGVVCADIAYSLAH